MNLQDGGGLCGRDGGNARAFLQQRDLAKELARLQVFQKVLGVLVELLGDSDLTTDNDVKDLFNVPLLAEDYVSWVRAYLGHAGQLCQVLLTQVGKSLGEYFHGVVGHWNLP